MKRKNKKKITNKTCDTNNNHLIGQNKTNIYIYIYIYIYNNNNNNQTNLPYASRDGSETRILIKKQRKNFFSKSKKICLRLIY